MKTIHKIFLGFCFVWLIGISLGINRNLEDNSTPGYIITDILFALIIPGIFGLYLFIQSKRRKTKQTKT